MLGENRGFFGLACKKIEHPGSINYAYRKSTVWVGGIVDIHAKKPQESGALLAV
jgi:hypothetical protein